MHQIIIKVSLSSLPTNYIEFPDPRLDEIRERHLSPTKKISATTGTRAARARNNRAVLSRVRFPAAAAAADESIAGRTKVKGQPTGAPPAAAPAARFLSARARQSKK